jgi:hypothetical protein
MKAGVVVESDNDRFNGRGRVTEHVNSSARSEIFVEPNHKKIPKLRGAAYSFQQDDPNKPVSVRHDVAPDGA